MATDVGALAQLKAARHQVGYVVAGLVVVLELVLDGDLLNSALPLVVAAAGVWLLIAVAPRGLFVATCTAAAFSTAVSLVIRLARREVFVELLGSDVWIVGIELIGLGVLATWAVRSLARTEAAVAVAAVLIALLALAAYRQTSYSYESLIRISLILGLGAAVGAGILLRDIDHERVTETELARHDERLAIARELHDVVAHHVTGIVVQAQAAQLVMSTQPQAATSALASIETAGSEALVAMRRMVGALRDAAADVPVAPAATMRDIQDLADRSTQLGLPVRLHVDDPRGLPPELVVSIHRIVREALTNAQRHAVGATSVDVSVIRNADHVEVDVRDDGSARHDRRSGGFGLIGMNERVTALGGLFVAGPHSEGGWQVHARLPLGRTSVGPHLHERVAT